LTAQTQPKETIRKQINANMFMFWLSFAQSFYSLCVWYEHSRSTCPKQKRTLSKRVWHKPGEKWSIISLQFRLLFVALEYRKAQYYITTARHNGLI
jgi:hypothetical protein